MVAKGWWGVHHTSRRRRPCSRRRYRSGLRRRPRTSLPRGHIGRIRKALWFATTAHPPLATATRAQPTARGGRPPEQPWTDTRRPTRILRAASLRRARARCCETAVRPVARSPACGPAASRRDPVQSTRDLARKVPREIPEADEISTAPTSRGLGTASICHTTSVKASDAALPAPARRIAGLTAIVYRTAESR